MKCIGIIDLVIIMTYWHWVLAHGYDEQDRSLQRIALSGYEDEKSISQRRVQDPSNHFFCGIGYSDASASCEYPCPSGSRSECPPGYLCYFDTPCDINDLLSKSIDESSTNSNLADSPSIIQTQTAKPTYPRQPTKAPWSENDPRLSMFCGKDWADASATCQVWCPDGDDDRCPYGQVCYADTTCNYTRPPTNKPTRPQPTQSPTVHPTEPTKSPVIAPLLEQPSNHMFCASDVIRVAESCSLETHCPNGPSDCKAGTFCWHNVMECDVRQYIPWEEGGLLGKPETATSGMTDKEIALSLGLTWPSLKESDHYFCGFSSEDANFRCSTPCSDGTAIACSHGQLCFYDTECDTRVHPEFYITDAPSPPTTSAPVNRNDKVNSAFCGVDWAEANTCTTKWCGVDMLCPDGKSCFADTDCNVLDMAAMKPTKSPTWSPVAYDDEVNNFFCGETFLDASNKCSSSTYCRSGKHSECRNNQYCWPGVPCNIKDMIKEDTHRPTVDTYEPTTSPLSFDNPITTRFCGYNWTHASSSCNDGRRPRWCPSGSDTECLDGQICFGDTMCHISTVVYPPSESPTGSPTDYASPPPTPEEPEYDDVIFTSFCGPTYQEASAACSIETYCPSGIHADCPNDQYCWSATTCNVHDFWPPPTPRPTNIPTIENLPSESPSRNPSIEPTGLPTLSPLAEDDPANFMYCGVDYGDASDRCRIKCPKQICPEGMNCYYAIGCPAIPYDSPAPMDPDPTLSPTLFVIKSTRPTTILLSNSFTSGTDSKAPSPDDVIFYSSHSPTSSIPLTSVSSTIGSEGFKISTLPTASPSILRSFSPTSRVHSSGYQIMSLPDVSMNMTPKSSHTNVQVVQKILEKIREPLENEVFVVETRAGNFLSSNMYAYDGFLSSLLYYTSNGINNDFFYLGDVEETIQYGLVNLALFLSKVTTDVVAYEFCNPSKLACGIWALDTKFSQKSRVLCSDSSENAGLECLDASVECACILGMLDHRVGSKSPFTTPYSDVHFCSTDPHETVCSKYLDKGHELRWLAPMSYWVSFIQRYDTAQTNPEKSYKLKLENFVQNGMQDTSFVEFVADIGIDESFQKSSREKFLAAYFKIIDLLSNALSTLVREESTPSPITKIPSLATTTPITTAPSILNVNPSEAKKCPQLCVAPIETIECPTREHTLKQCFSNFIGLNELCLASYGECNTSEDSLNDCARSYNVFRRIDCSVLEQSSTAPMVVQVSSNPPSEISKKQEKEQSVLDSTYTSNTPSTKQPPWFEDSVWWQNINSSSGKRNYQSAFYFVLVFLATTFPFIPQLIFV